MKRALTEKDLLNLTKKQASEVYQQGEEAVIWALLKLSVMAQENGKPKVKPAIPSSQIAPYQKPTNKKRKRKRGRKKGHKGVRRRPPLTIDQHQEHTLEMCPECGTPVNPSCEERQRIIEDIEQSRVVTTEHTIHSHYCPRCKKCVEPKVSDALPKSTIGNRALVLSSWLHYGLGNTTSQIVSVFNSLFHFSVSAGGLTHQWQRLAQILTPWYEQIADKARKSAVLNADETGWRVQGKTHWLWCFTTPELTYYTIDPSRGSNVLNRFLADCFEGTLVSDFFSAYNKVDSQRQLCLSHLLGELKKVSEKNIGYEWTAFNKTLKRLLKDALRLSRRTDRDAHDFDSKRSRIHMRLDTLCARTLNDPDCHRLLKRLKKHRDSLFTFLDEPNVPPDNNRAEREIRPAVIARKNSFHNMSANGANTQAIMMSVYRTLKLREHDPLHTIIDSVSLFISTGELPALPRPP